MNDATKRTTLRTAGLMKGAAAALCVLLLGVGACELDVSNPNAPDTERVLATPGDVESLIVSSFNAYWDVSQSNIAGIVSECAGSGSGWLAALTNMADHSTSGWGNYGMSTFGGEPREALPNSRADEDGCLMSNAWFRAYQGIAAAREGLLAMGDGLSEGEGVELQNPQRARAWAKFSQGLLHGWLAMIYDQAFVVDETVPLVDDAGNAVDLPFASYQEMLNASLGYFQQALDIANANQFTTPGTWLNGRSLTSDEFASLVHGYMARLTVRNARNPSERNGMDWSVIENHLDNAHTFDLIIQGDLGAWWTGLKVWSKLGAPGQFAAVDQRTVGPGDVSGAWENYVNAPIDERFPFDVESPDQRIPEASPGVEVGCLLGLDHPACGNPPLLIGYNTSTWFPAQPALLSHYSSYETIIGTQCNFTQPDFSWTGQVCEFTQRDLSFLKAEARMQQGDMEGGADILNDFRVQNGELPEANANGVQDQSPDECVPQRADGTCGDLWDVLAYERFINLLGETSGSAWADKRGWGRLQPGTAIHLPVPARELETIGEDIYTFGGEAGGAALRAGSGIGEGVPIIRPGDLESVLAKVKWSLNTLEAQRQARPMPPLVGWQPGDGPPTGILKR